MRKNVLVLALVATVLPALALAAQPVRIRIDRHYAPVREVVQVLYTAGGPVRVHTWSWRGPGGAATVQVTESHGGISAMPVWAMARRRALQVRMQLIRAMLEQPIGGASFPVSVVFGQPVWLALPGEAPVEVRYLRSMLPLRVTPLRARILVLLPTSRAHTAHPASARPRGHLI